MSPFRLGLRMTQDTTASPQYFLPEPSLEHRLPFSLLRWTWSRRGSRFLRFLQPHWLSRFSPQVLPKPGETTYTGVQDAIRKISRYWRNVSWSKEHQCPFQRRRLASLLERWNCKEDALVASIWNHACCLWTRATDAIRRLWWIQVTSSFFA